MEIVCARSGLMDNDRDAEGGAAPKVKIIATKSLILDHYEANFLRFYFTKNGGATMEPPRRPVSTMLFGCADEVIE
jgi:hypothetical protein